MTPLQAFLHDIAPIAGSTDKALLAVKSRDYFWYSPILTELLDTRVGDAIVTPRAEQSGERGRVERLTAFVECDHLGGG